jgi:hypothetical protein
MGTCKIDHEHMVENGKEPDYFYRQLKGMKSVILEIKCNEMSIYVFFKPSAPNGVEYS